MDIKATERGVKGVMDIFIVFIYKKTNSILVEDVLVDLLWLVPGVLLIVRISSII